MFTKAYDSSPVLTQNLTEAKKLIQQAGATGKTITIGTSSQLASLAAVTGAYQAAAQAIGLKVALKSVRGHVDIQRQKRSQEHYRSDADGQGRIRSAGVRGPGGPRRSGASPPACGGCFDVGLDRVDGDRHLAGDLSGVQ